jgi:hypothetical protein
MSHICDVAITFVERNQMYICPRFKYLTSYLYPEQTYM